jgi:hypothetical protein
MAGLGPAIYRGTVSEEMAGSEPPHDVETACHESKLTAPGIIPTARTTALRTNANHVMAGH